MKTRGLILVLALGLMISAFGQKPTMEFTFTAENNGQYVPLDSIFIENLTQGGDTTLYAPDTVLSFEYNLGVNEIDLSYNSFFISQNYPNPFKGKTTVNLYLPKKEDIKINVRDLLGRKLDQYENLLNRGNHSFVFYSGNEKYYLLTVTGKQTSKTIKMLNANGNTTFGGKCKIVYNEYGDNLIGYKSQKAITDFIFNPGDQLRYTGYAKTVNEVNGSDVIEDAPQTNTTYEFDIFEGIPCPGISTITYEGQVYNTVLIGSQCWLKENLNVGTMINGNEGMTDNGTIEKYCYYNDPANCDTYGGLYQWDEIMQYTTTQGVQGICPPDWHLPTDDEWKILEGTIDSQYLVGDPEWDDTLLRGFDAGLNLKSASYWCSGGNGTDEYGFTALPGGSLYSIGNFGYLGANGVFWSSTEGCTSHAWIRDLIYCYDEVSRSDAHQLYGFSVRCLKD